jgi:hypothetical protein
MEKHLLATPLVAIALLLSTLGCSKKNDPAAEHPAIVASYMLSGTLIKCTASSQVVTSGLGTDYLTLTLTTTPQPATGAQRLQLTFTKSTGQPLAAYQLLNLSMFQGNTTFQGYIPDRSTFTSSSSSSVSSNFSSTSIYPTIASDITSGIFTDVEL